MVIVFTLIYYYLQNTSPMMCCLNVKFFVKNNVFGNSLILVITHKKKGENFLEHECVDFGEKHDVFFKTLNHHVLLFELKTIVLHFNYNQTFEIVASKMIQKIVQQNIQINCSTKSLHSLSFLKCFCHFSFRIK